MRYRLRQSICVVLMLGLILASIRYEVTPVQAAGVSSDTDYYEWHRAYTTDDLKKYVDEYGKTTDYKNKWVPIVIVACYGNQSNPTMYYWNSDCTLKTFYSDVLLPTMNRVDNRTDTGMYLLDAINNNKEDSFITKGDLGAMHMYYHGEQSSKYSDGTITEEAWSLSSDIVEDYSSSSVGTVWGVNTELTMEFALNSVRSWDESGGLPTTIGVADETYKTAWTFYQDKTAGQFVISNLFSQPLGEKLNPSFFSSGSKVAAVTLGAASDGLTDYAHDMLKGECLTIIWNSNKGKVVNGDEARTAILNSYYDYFSDAADRASFRIYVGEKMESQATLSNTVVSDGATMQLGYGNIIKEGASVTVEEGGTLIIPENGLLYLDGTIHINGGTVIVSRNATITSDSTTTVRQGIFDRGTGYTGRIECVNGGALVIQKGAKLYLNHGLLLDNGTCINNGMLILNQMLSMDHATLEIKAQGFLGLGFSYGTQPKFFYQETKRPSQNLSASSSVTTYKPSAMEFYFAGNSSVVISGSSQRKLSDVIEMSELAYEFVKADDEYILEDFADETYVYCDTFTSPYVENGDFSFKTVGNSGSSGSKTTQLILRKHENSNPIKATVNSGLLTKGYMTLTN